MAKTGAGKRPKIYYSECIIKKPGRPKKQIEIDGPVIDAKEYRRRKREKKIRQIGVIDCETDPFDNVGKGRILPFLFVIHADEFEPVVIWDENFPRLIRRLMAELERIEKEFGAYTFYAHNGGKFDFLFFIHKLRGAVSFKGRGIMAARIGGHELRDSFHIIPEKLAAYQKDEFDYSKLRKGEREKHKAEAIRYCIADCRYLLDIVKGFAREFGLKLSIGQAAMAELKRHYKVEKFSEGWDAYVRTYFYGGRVECLQGRGEFVGAYKLYDVNSMYPFVMANYQHPVGGFFEYDLRAGDPGAFTCFIDLDCTNDGALIGRDENGATTARIKRGRFLTTIWEYEMGLRHGLIRDVEINFCLDCSQRSDFSLFVNPLYERRQQTKKLLGEMKRHGMDTGPQYLETKKDDIFLKLLLNNAYGKFAQNPRNFKEHYLTDPGEMPPQEWLKSLEKLRPGERDLYLQPAFESAEYWIWIKPAPGWTFNNVGTAASITGAARAVLLDAICKAKDPIYCDTDSLICRDLPGVDIHKEHLGAWDIEDEFSRVIINGKKLYSCLPASANGQIGKAKVKSKGVSGLDWGDMVALLNGAEIAVSNKGPTLTKFGTQDYIMRKIRATAHIQENRL